MNPRKYKTGDIVEFKTTAHSYRNVVMILRHLRYDDRHDEHVYKAYWLFDTEVEDGANFTNRVEEFCHSPSAESEDDTFGGTYTLLCSID